MKANVIYQIAKADLLEKTRKFSFIAICAAVMFLAFFSVPDIKAPIVSIAMEPAIFKQGNHASWIPISIALCGGLLFPVIGFSFCKNNICMDRANGLLYLFQSMNMKKSHYIIGKFISNLALLTFLWILVMISASIMLPLQFPEQQIGFYDFISPLFCFYPGIIFAAACAVLIESISFIKKRHGNVIGIIFLFVLFLVNYSNADSSDAILRIFDFSGYRWIMESINHSVFPLIGRKVQETGIMVPGGLFAESAGLDTLVFHGLIPDSRYVFDKCMLIAVSMCFLFAGILFLSSTEKEHRASFKKNRLKTAKHKSCHYRGQFANEVKIIFRDYSKGWHIAMLCLWIACFFVPLTYIQKYLWIIMLLFSVGIFSQMGCRNYECGTKDLFITMKSGLRKQLFFNYLQGFIFLMVLSFPAMIKVIMQQEFSYILTYLAFAIFLPALAIFSGVCFKSRRPFETLFLLFCFFLMNTPLLLFNGCFALIMPAASFILLFAIYKKTGL